MIELIFIAENFQCGPEAPLAQFEVLINEGTQTEKTLTVGDSVQIPEWTSISVIPVLNAECMKVFEFMEVTEDNIPDLPGLYDQPDVASYLEALTDSESIFLYEFGSKDGDYQDIILRVDWNVYEPYVD